MEARQGVSSREEGGVLMCMQCDAAMSGERIRGLEGEVARLRALLVEAREALKRHRILLGGLGPRIDAALGGEEGE